MIMILASIVAAREELLVPTPSLLLVVFQLLSPLLPESTRLVCC